MFLCGSAAREIALLLLPSDEGMDRRCQHMAQRSTGERKNQALCLADVVTGRASLARGGTAEVA
jgi:hypothetical protein